MSNIATVLKEEVTRLARRELRAETEALKKASSQYRADIAALKRQVTLHEKHIARLIKGVAKVTPIPTPKTTTNIRFSAKGLQTQRAKLGLSAADMGTLIGVSAQTIYNWEAGKAKPRQQQLPAIGALRGRGKKEVMARLEELAA